MTRISQLVAEVEVALMNIDYMHFLHLTSHVRGDSGEERSVEHAAPGSTADVQEIFRGSDSDGVKGSARSWLSYLDNSSDTAARIPAFTSRDVSLPGTKLVQTESSVSAYTQTGQGMRSGVCVRRPVTSIDQLYAQAVLLQPLLRIKVQQLAADCNGLVLVSPARSCFSRGLCLWCVLGSRADVSALVLMLSSDGCDLRVCSLVSVYLLSADGCA